MAKAEANRSAAGTKYALDTPHPWTNTTGAPDELPPSIETRAYVRQPFTVSHCECNGRILPSCNKRLRSRSATAIRQATRVLAPTAAQASDDCSRQCDLTVKEEAFPPLGKPHQCR
jgi:hypothetical protein